MNFETISVILLVLPAAILGVLVIVGGITR
jgi:hypothetical protein